MLKGVRDALATRAACNPCSSSSDWVLEQVSGESGVRVLGSCEAAKGGAVTPGDEKLIGSGFRYGPKFYRPNDTLRVIAVSGGIGLLWATSAWPRGDRELDHAEQAFCAV